MKYAKLLYHSDWSATVKNTRRLHETVGGVNATDYFITRKRRKTNFSSDTRGYGII